MTEENQPREVPGRQQAVRSESCVAETGCNSHTLAMHRMGSYFEPTAGASSTASSSLAPPPPPPTSSIPQKPVLKRPTLSAIGIPTGVAAAEAPGRFGFVTNTVSE